MTRVCTVLLIAALACSACSADHQGGSGAHSMGPLSAPLPSSALTRADDLPEPHAWPTAAPAPSEPAAPDGCPVACADRLDTIVTAAIHGLAHTTAADGWSRACAQVEASDGSASLRTVTIKVGWMGTLHDYASSRGAKPIIGLADEAYALDAGHQIALRSGELVAVVGFSAGTPSETRALARRVADRLREER